MGKVPEAKYLTLKVYDGSHTPPREVKPVAAENPVLARFGNHEDWYRLLDLANHGMAPRVPASRACEAGV